MQIINLKKTSKIDYLNEDVAVLDESRCQNGPNTKRRICENTVDGNKDPNLAVRTGKRFGANAIGIQGINCKSGIFFNIKNNANNFALALCEYSINRFRNPIVLEKLINIINDPTLYDINIKLKLLYPEITNKKHNDLFNIDNNLNYKKFKYLCKKYKINYYKINKAKKELILKHLYDDNLINLIKNEKKN